MPLNNKPTLEWGARTVQSAVLCKELNLQQMISAEGNTEQAQMLLSQGSENCSVFITTEEKVFPLFYI